MMQVLLLPYKLVCHASNIAIYQFHNQLKNGGFGYEIDLNILTFQCSVNFLLELHAFGTGREG